MPTKNKEKQHYNKDYFVNLYNNRLFKGYRPFHHMYWVRYLKKVKQNGKLLEIGCGGGFFLKWAEKYWDTYGIDISEYAILRARKKLKKTNLIIGDINNLTSYYKNNYFDIIVAFDVFEHLKEPDFVLNKILKIIKNSGIFIITAPNLSSISLKWKGENWFGFRDKTHLSLLTNEEWLFLLRKNQFYIIEYFYDGLWDTPYFKNIPVFLQHLLIKIPSGILFGIVKFPKKFSENICIVAIKKLKIP